MIMIGIGLAAAFPTVVIPVLRGLQNDRNPAEFLFLSDVEASWYGMFFKYFDYFLPLTSIHRKYRLHRSAIRQYDFGLVVRTDWTKKLDDPLQYSTYHSMGIAWICKFPANDLCCRTVDGTRNWYIGGTDYHVSWWNLVNIYFTELCCIFIFYESFWFLYKTHTHI